MSPMTSPLETLFVVPALVFVLSLAALVLYRLLTGAITTRGLITHRETGEASTIQIQNLISTLVAVAAYVAAIGNHTGEHSFPPVSPELLLLLGGSNLLLVAGRGTSNTLKTLLRSR